MQSQPIVFLPTSPNRLISSSIVNKLICKWSNCINISHENYLKNSNFELNGLLCKRKTIFIDKIILIPIVYIYGSPTKATNIKMYANLLNMRKTL